MRWQGSWIPTQRHATNPEKVLVYKKSMRVYWKRINRKLQAVTGLDDVMRFDLHHFCRSVDTASSSINDSECQHESQPLAAARIIESHCKTKCRVQITVSC